MSSECPTCGVLLCTQHPPSLLNPATSASVANEQRVGLNEYSDTTDTVHSMDAVIHPSHGGVVVNNEKQCDEKTDMTDIVAPSKVFRCGDGSKAGTIETGNRDPRGGVGDDVESRYDDRSKDTDSYTETMCRWRGCKFYVSTFGICTFHGPVDRAVDSASAFAARSDPSENRRRKMQKAPEIFAENAFHKAPLPGIQPSRATPYTRHMEYCAGDGADKGLEQCTTGNVERAIYRLGKDTEVLLMSAKRVNVQYLEAGTILQCIKNGESVPLSVVSAKVLGYIAVFVLIFIFVFVLVYLPRYVNDNFLCALSVSADACHPAIHIHRHEVMNKCSFIIIT